MAWRVSVLVCLIAVPSEHSAGKPISLVVLGSLEANIYPPPDGLVPEVAALLRAWEGAREGNLPACVIVERIDADPVRVIYAWADHPAGTDKGDRMQVRATGVVDERLQRGSKATNAFEMGKGQDDATR